MKKEFIAIAIAAIVVVSAVGVYFFVSADNDDGSDDSQNVLKDTRLVVYGNANHDDYLDEEDVQFIQDIIDEKSTWNKTTNYFADTNADGEVTIDDVELLEKFLNKEKAKMYYQSWDLEVKSVNFPMTGNVSGNLDSTLLMGSIVGFYDRVTHLLQDQASINAISGEMYPGASSKVKSIGTYPYTFENVVASGVKIVLGNPYCFDETFLKRISESSDINVVLLPQDMVVNGESWSTTIVTLGVMMGLEENTKDYIDYCDSVQEKIDLALGGTTAEDQLTYLITLQPTSKVTVDVDIHGTGPEMYGDVYTMEILPLKCAMEPRGASGYVSVEVEEFLQVNPDVIIIDTFGYVFSDSYDEEAHQAAFEEMASIFSKTDAYKNGMVFGVAYECYGSIPGIAGILLLASMIWPDEFDADEGWAILQEFYDKFTYLEGDIRDQVGVAPLQLGN